MITQAELQEWIKSEDIFVEPIEGGFKFAGDNPWDEVQNGDYHGSLRLVNGVLHVSFVEGGWNGYGDEEFHSIGEFAARWTDVMQNGLTG